jgi:hypothetical protein
MAILRAFCGWVRDVSAARFEHCLVAMAVPLRIDMYHRVATP